MTEEQHSWVDIAIQVSAGAAAVAGALLGLVPVLWPNRRIALVWIFWSFIQAVLVGVFLYSRQGVWQGWHLLPGGTVSAWIFYSLQVLLLGTFVWWHVKIRAETPSLGWSPLSGWPAKWQDIVWHGHEGWLAGVRWPDSDKGGILFYTRDGGVNWVDTYPSGLPRGKDSKGRDQFYSWDEVKSINAVELYPRHGEADRQIEIWLATSNGIYYSEDAGSTWNHITPPPIPSDQLFGLTKIEGDQELYAVGWPGIGHWSRGDSNWYMQLATGSYWIAAVRTVGRSANRVVWAVGLSGHDEMGEGNASRGAVYRLQGPDGHWEMMDLGGIEFKQGQGLSDICLVGEDQVFAVGMEGMILKGSQNRNGTWAWARLESGTHEHLSSIDCTNGKLWVVGEGGTILESRNLGRTWIPRTYQASQGKPSLKRVKFNGDTGYILGDRVFLKSTSPQETSPN